MSPRIGIYAGIAAHHRRANDRTIVETTRRHLSSSETKSDSGTSSGFRRDAGIRRIVVFIDIAALRPRIYDPRRRLRAISHIVMVHAEQLLALATHTPPNITATVRAFLTEGMAQGPKTLSLVAEQMLMSERSLQRRLESEGTRFAKLADEVRKELALRYIADRHLALGEVAYLLGFADPSPFHRAFKRWTGMTPAVARQAKE